MLAGLLTERDSSDGADVKYTSSDGADVKYTSSDGADVKDTYGCVAQLRAKAGSLCLSAILGQSCPLTSLELGAQGHG